MGNKGSETVLVVDDDPMVLGFIEAEISQHGYRAILASSAEEALHKAENQRIDLLLTDVMMPGMNGVELAQELIVTNPETKVLFMSGYVAPTVAPRGIPENGYSYVQKPFAPDSLVDTMRSVLNTPNGLGEPKES